MRKRLLFVTLDFWPNKIGGVATYYYHVCKELAKRHHVDVLTDILEEEKYDVETEIPRPHKRTELTQIPFHIIRVSFFYERIFPRWLRGYFALKKLTKHHAYDHVLVGEILPIGTICYVLSLMGCMKKYSVFLHGLDIASLRGRKAWLAKRVLKRAHVIYCNSQFTASLVKPYLSSQRKIQIVYPCPNMILKEIQPQEVPEIKRFKQENRYIILTVSRLVKRKGIQYIIQSVKEIRTFMPNMYYVIVGNGPWYIQLHKMIEQENLQEHVGIFPHMNDAQLAYIYKHSDLFILTPEYDPHDVEGFGIVYLEANLFGLAVIATNTGGVSEAVINEKTGLLLDQLTIADIVKTVHFFYKHPQTARALGEYGQKRISQEFLWEKQVQNICKHL